MRKRGRETSMCGCLLCAPTGDLYCNPGMCPDWESNWRPFGSQPELNPPSYTSQGRTAVLSFCFEIFNNIFLNRSLGLFKIKQAAFFLVNESKVLYSCSCWPAQLVRAMSCYSKVAGLIPGQGTYKNQPMSA